MIFWGDKTIALFDVWSIEHFMTGIFIGAFISTRTNDILQRLPKNYRYRYHFYKVMAIAFFWECIEHYLEAGLLSSVVTTWFRGVELWANRLITDPLLVLCGYCIVQRYPRITLPARLFSVIWLILHIFVFPDCMYLQDKLTH